MELRRVGQGCVLGCERARGLPTRLLCVLVLVGQAAVLDYYLIAFTSLASAAWLLVDTINIVLVVATLVVSLSRERSAQSGEAPRGFVRRFKSMAWFAWFVYGSTVAVKTITLFRANIVAQLGETDVVGKNLLKTAIAGSGCLFLLLLLTQHPASPASQTGRCLQDLTGTVLFDILDTVDMLEILFEAGGREKAGLGAEVVPLLLATINLAAPSIPLLTLVDTNFGQRRLSRRVVVIHKVATTLVVNVPNLLLRMVFWTRFSVGVSPFILKNFVMVALALYEAYEHLRGTVRWTVHDRRMRRRNQRGLSNPNAPDTKASTTRRRFLRERVEFQLLQIPICLRRFLCNRLLYEPSETEAGTPRSVYSISSVLSQQEE